VVGAPALQCYVRSCMLIVPLKNRFFFLKSKDLSIGEKELRSRKEMFLRALSLAKTPVLIAMFVTPIRFSLELAGLP
jgi:hypothetical protein